MEVKATVGEYILHLWETQAGISLEVRKNKEDRESRGVHLLFTTEGQVKIYPREGRWFISKHNREVSMAEFLESFVQMKGNKEEEMRVKEKITKIEEKIQDMLND